MKMTLGLQEWMERFLDYERVQHFSPNTVEAQGKMLRRFRQFCAGLGLAGVRQVTREVICNYQACLYHHRKKNGDTGDIILTITDHLEWDNKNEHLLLLQEKINAYLAFIESGEIDEQYPNAKSRKRVIKIIALHHPNEMGQMFVSRAQKIIEGAGFGFCFEQKHFNSPP